MARKPVLNRPTNVRSSSPKLGPILSPKLSPKLDPKLSQKIDSKLSPKLGPKFSSKVDSKLSPKLGPKLSPKLGPKFSSKIGFNSLAAPLSNDKIDNCSSGSGSSSSNGISCNRNDFNTSTNICGSSGSFSSDSRRGSKSDGSGSGSKSDGIVSGKSDSSGGSKSDGSGSSGSKSDGSYSKSDGGGSGSKSDGSSGSDTAKALSQVPSSKGLREERRNRQGLSRSGSGSERSGSLYRSGRSYSGNRCRSDSGSGSEKSGSWNRNSSPSPQRSKLPPVSGVNRVEETTTNTAASGATNSPMTGCRVTNSPRLGSRRMLRSVTALHSGEPTTPPPAGARPSPPPKLVSWDVQPFLKLSK